MVFDSQQQKESLLASKCWPMRDLMYRRTVDYMCGMHGADRGQQDRTSKSSRSESGCEECSVNMSCSVWSSCACMRVTVASRSFLALRSPSLAFSVSRLISNSAFSISVCGRVRLGCHARGCIMMLQFQSLRHYAEPLACVKAAHVHEPCSNHSNHQYHNIREGTIH
jgi:hypothetical protein